ncbi:hypothetical protein H920_18789 [Fukomys damarensis]|uniref:Uncharacterized protein n=1 Tax=Fukomys damarensis TaxID=885580 RepID=A0A091CR32_FUKDA|nr:hypothetical protein H920_18789 [Fukomys damarensis]
MATLMQALALFPLEPRWEQEGKEVPRVGFARCVSGGAVSGRSISVREQRRKQALKTSSDLQSSGDHSDENIVTDELKVLDAGEHAAATAFKEGPGRTPKGQGRLLRGKKTDHGASYILPTSQAQASGSHFDEYKTNSEGWDEVPAEVYDLLDELWI